MEKVNYTLQNQRTMSEKAKEFLAERGIANNEMIEGAYGSAYYLSGMLETFANQETKAKDKEIQKLNLERLMEVEQYEARIKELEEGLRECEEVFDQMEEGSMCKYIEKLINQNKDE